MEAEYVVSRSTSAGEITVTIHRDGYVKVEHRIEECFGDHVDEEREWVELHFHFSRGPVVVEVHREPESAFSTGAT